MNATGRHHRCLSRLQAGSLIVGAIAAGLCVLGAFLDWHQFLRSYLVAFTFWTEIAVGCLALGLLHQLVHGAWGLSTSRVFEAGAATIPLNALTAIPLAFGIGELYPWAHQSASADTAHASRAALYLNVPSFAARAVLYFAVWIVLSVLMNRGSVRQESDQSPARLRANRLLGAVGLLLTGLTLSFAAIDWLMSLEPEWYSSMYGALVAIGAVLLAFAFTIAVLARLAPGTELKEVAPPEIVNDLGSLMLTFVILWTYLAYSQYLIIWSGNLAEEITWYLRRLHHGWQWVGLTVLVFQFVLPFLLLLSRERKRSLSALARIAGALLLVGYVNQLWMTAPAFEGASRIEEHAYAWHGIELTFPPLHWLDLAAPLAVGGLWVGWFCRQLGRKALVPTQEPAWENFRQRVAAHE